MLQWYNRTNNQNDVPAMRQHPGTRPKHMGGASMRNIISGIYAIVNTQNGHKYIGSAVDVSRRIKKHKNELRKGIHHSRHLQNAWNKYGESSFRYSILAIVNKEELLIIEQKFIDKLEPEYNVSPTAGNRLGCVHLESTRKKISDSHIGMRPSEETRKKLISSHKGFKIGDETKLKMSEASKGKYRGWSNKPVFQFTKSGELVNRFDSIMDAERATGIGNSKIVRCCKGKRKSAGGFAWRYAADEFTSYEYLQDPGGNYISEYPDENNHSIDRVRYATNLTWRKRGK